MKNKREFGETWHFLKLKLTIIDVWNMPNGLMTN